MRLNQLKLYDFRCFHDLELTFDRPVNFIFGPNASGKSTIAEAIEMALTGRCNGNLGWRERSALARQGSEGYKIDLKAQLPGQEDVQGIAHRPDPKDCIPKPEDIAKRLGVGKEALTALFDTGHFFTLHPDEKKRLIFDLLGLRVGRDNLEDHLRSWLRDQAGLLRKHNLEPEEDLLTVLGDTPETLEQAYEQAFDERRIIKRELKTLSGERGTVEGMTPELIRQRIEEIQSQLNGFHTRMGELKGMALAERRQVERGIQDAASTLERLRAEIVAFDEEAETRRMKELEGQRAEVQTAIQVGNQVRKDVNEKIQAIHAEANRKKAIHARVEKFDGTCPLLVQDPPVACKTEEILKAINKIRKASQTEVSEIQKEKESLESSLADVSTLIKKNQLDTEEIERKIAAIVNGIERHAQAISRIRQLETKKAMAEQTLSGLPGENVEESERIQEEVRLLQGDLERNRGLLIISEQTDRRAALERKLAVLEVLTLAFSPKGIMADLLSAATKSLNNSLTALMGCLSGGRYSLEMQVNEDVDVSLIGHAAGTRTPIRFVSTSERFRAGIVLQCVLSKLTGLRFMLIDGLDILDQENRGFFFRFIQEAKADFDSIFVFSTIGPYPPKDPGIPDIGFWVIEEEMVRRISEENA